MTKTASKPDTLSIAELAASLAEGQDLSKARAKAIIDTLRDHVVETLLTGNRVSLFGLGTFEVRATKAKMGRNPKTGEKIEIPAGRKVVFKVAKGLKDQM
ncbi:MAG TPA: HU family DNA-binding protein [Holophagaceae bacterium]|jgi:nucleoid DNA-binding protein|nr:HU family DNA-binding protein [Acidobacteriota bacterium]HJW33613.1 HU family DNA-binding protein [Holophagaceae bacterium]